MAGQPDAADDLIAELAKLMAEDAKGAKPAQSEAKAPFTVRIPGEPAPGSAPRPAASSVSVVPSVAGPTSPLRSQSSPASTPATNPVDPAHDSIADLIAAELAGDQPSAKPQDPNLPAGRDMAPDPAPAKASPRAAPPPDQDSFRIAPVFGLGTEKRSPVDTPPVAASAVSVVPVEPASTPTPRIEPTTQQSLPERSAGARSSDAIEDIENLIGRAMRVDFDKPVQETSKLEAAAPAPPSPSLRSLATPTVAATAAQKAAREVTSADEAILAAAQASGVEIGWVDHTEPDPEPEVAPVARARSRRPRTGKAWSRAVVGPLVAVGLLIAAGLGLYWALGLDRQTGPAPLLVADSSPTKEIPVAEPEAEPATQSVVFNEMSGEASTAEEQLVSRDQADVNEVTQLPPAAVSEEGIANRKVRTVTVRPDGTIVSGDNAVAGSAILPVDRPEVPPVPGAEAGPSSLLASASAFAPPETSAASAAAATAAAATAEPDTTITPPAEAATTPPVTPVEPGTTVAAVDAAGAEIPGRTAPVPLERPNFSTAQLAAAAANAAVPATGTADVVANPAATGTLPPPPGGATPAVTSPQQPQAAAAPTASAPPPPGVEAPAYVQLSSQRTEDAARTTAQQIANRYGPLFNGASLEVQRVDLGARGIFYRVRVPANSAQEANSLCTNIKAAGGDCFTM